MDIFLVIKSNSPGHGRSAKLPPGPNHFVIIRNILQLGRNPHQSLAKLSRTYGPLMHIKIGTINTIVVSSPKIAKELFQKHDQSFSSRPNLSAFDAFNHNNFSVIWLPATKQWRDLRKLSKEHMFSTHRLNSSESLRQEKLQKLRAYVKECCNCGRVLDIGDSAFTTSINLISASLFSTDIPQFNSDSSQDLKEIMLGIMKIAGTPNLADYFPIFKPIDPQGVKRKCATYMRKLFEIFDYIINQRLQSEDGTTANSISKNDLLQALLDLAKNQESKFTRNDIMHLLLDLFVAGPETIAVTVEWAMAELLQNPEKMCIARNELHNVVGDNSQICESDISKLPYLQGVIKETFRLHPVGPLSVPHKADNDIELNGHLIPKNAQILFNLWEMGRNPNLWSDPDLFKPERFLDHQIDIGGQDFELIPFGSGRRICLGLPMAYRAVHLMVASLIHNFDWKLEGGMKPEEMDMNDKFEFSLHKRVPLKAIPLKL